MNRRPLRYWLTYLWTAPWDLAVVWPTVLLIWLLWGRKLHWLDGVWCELKYDSWPSRTWYKGWGGTTLGHGGFYASGFTGDKGLDTSTEIHEHIHVEQYEAAMLGSFLVSVVAFLIFHSWWFCLGAWSSGYLVMGISNWLQAWFRGESLYMGSAHEESAYAQTKLKHLEG
jgi:hypothetical protein